MTDNRKKPAAKRDTGQPAAKARPGGPRKPLRQAKSSGPSAMMLTWIAVGVVLAIVAGIVIYSTTKSDAAGAHETLVSAKIFDEVTHVPASVFNEVGVSSPSIEVAGLERTKATNPPLTYTVDGKQIPGAFYWGAEYCPYCAATRWSIILAMSRFGTWNKLYTMSSSPSDVYPNTQTFSFYGTTYTSKYLVFKTFEVEGPVNNGVTLQKTPAKETALVNEFNSSQSFPFMDIGNNEFLTSAAYDPQVLQNLSRGEIAGALDDPSNVITRAIVAEANYIDAGVCATDKLAPASVCDSAGVQDAMKALKLPS